MSTEAKNFVNHYPAENIQDLFLKQLVENQAAVSLFLMNGIRLQGVITNFDAYAIFIASKNSEVPMQMVYKRRISSVMLN